jgi:hypothetical protein
MKAKIKKAMFWFTVVFGALAVVDQLRQPATLRTWNGDVAGVPYDFRPPTPSRLRARWWNSSDHRLFVPKAFGVGWDINFHRLVYLAMHLGNSGSQDDDWS